jgi:hypothetical protein
MTSGSMAYPAAKAKRDCSMPLKREAPEDVYGAVLQDPRAMVTARLPEPQPPAMQAYIPRHNVCCEAALIGRQNRRRSNLPQSGRGGMTALKGADAAPTARSTRLSARECGMARRVARRRVTECPY